MKNLFIFFLLLSIFSCTKENATEPDDELIMKGEYVIDTLIAIQDTFIVAPPIRTSYSSKLSIGKYEGFSANFLIRFVFLPADTISLDSAHIELTGESFFGSNSQSITVNAYKVEDQWDRDANKEDYWRNYIPNGDLVFSGDFTLSDSIKYKIPIDNALIKEWQSIPDSSQTGLYFTMAPGSEGAIEEISSFNTIGAKNAPKLIYKRATDSTAVWDTLIIGDDLTIFPPDENGIFQNDQNLYIASGNPVQTFIKFDLSVLPEKILLYSAELQANTDSTNTLINPNHPSNFYLRLVTEANEDLSSFTIDSGFVYNYKENILIEKEGNRLQLDLNNKINFGQFVIQKIVNEEKEYKWFFLQYILENSSISVERVMGVKNSAPKEKLIIKYFKIDGFGC